MERVSSCSKKEEERSLWKMDLFFTFVLFPEVLIYFTAGRSLEVVLLLFISGFCQPGFIIMGWDYV
jgi:hypothetical protein